VTALKPDLSVLRIGIDRARIAQMIDVRSSVETREAATEAARSGFPSSFPPQHPPKGPRGAKEGRIVARKAN